MANETPAGSFGASDGEGPDGRGPGEQSPLQARAQFLKNWSWDLVVSLNRGACARGGAQHGFNREAQTTVQKDWESKKAQVLSLSEVIDFLRSCHRSAPFLFFNGNTFADIGRQLIQVLLGDLPQARRRQAGSAIAHYIAGVLDREPMVKILESLLDTAEFQPGDRVSTFRGSLRGTITRLLPDGKVAWKPDGRSGELLSLPESLIREPSA